MIARVGPFETLLVALALTLALARGAQAQSLPPAGPADLVLHSVSALGPTAQFNGAGFSPVEVLVGAPYGRTIPAVIECAVGALALRHEIAIAGTMQVRVPASPGPLPGNWPTGHQRATCTLRARDPLTADPNATNNQVSAELDLPAPTIPDLRWAEHSAPRVHECDTTLAPIPGRALCLTVHRQYQDTHWASDAPGTRTTCTMDGRPVASQATSRTEVLRFDPPSTGSHELACTLHPRDVSLDRDPSNNTTRVRFDVLPERRYDVALTAIAEETAPDSIAIHGCHSTHYSPAVAVLATVTNQSTHPARVELRCTVGAREFGSWTSEPIPVGQSATLRAITSVDALPRGASTAACTVNLAEGAPASDADPSNNRRTGRVVNRVTTEMATQAIRARE